MPARANQAEPETPLSHGDLPRRIHVYPTFGPEHAQSLDCWCHPELDAQEPRVCVHNAQN